MDNILKTLLRSHEYFLKYLFVKVMNKIFLRRLLGFFYLRMLCSVKIYKQVSVTDSFFRLSHFRNSLNSCHSSIIPI